MKILIPGGHITPALAVAEVLRSRGHDVVFVGRTIEAGGLSLEAKLLQKAKFRTIGSIAGRLTRTVTLSSLFHLMLIPLGFMQAFFIIVSENPAIILSFGGYIALPLAFWGCILGKKVYTHEQTMIPGLANRIIAFFCQKVFLTFADSIVYFDRKKVILTGNPIRKDLLTPHSKPEWFTTTNAKPILLVMGGALGAHSINLHIEKLLPDLATHFTVVHQTGNVTAYGDYERLSKHASDTYHVREHLTTAEVSYFFQHSALIISRAGANTVLELCLVKLPSILIPLPISGGGEQKAQALWMQRMGVSKLFSQYDNSQDLRAMIDTVYQYREDMKEEFKNIHLTLDAEEKIVAQLAP